MKVEAFVVTLERAVHRRPQVAQIRATCPVRCQIAAAVDGATLLPDEVAKMYRPRLHRPYYPLTLRMGEIGCFLSHRSLWQRIVQDGIDAALIIEDDVELQMPGFAASFAFVLANVQPGDYLQFQVRDIGSRHPVVVTDGRHAIVQTRVAPLRTSAQLVTRLAAERLLAVTESFDRPVDTFLQMRWLTKVPIKVVQPWCVKEVSAQIGGSTIGGRKPLLTRLRHELLRPIYRAQIHLRSLLGSRAA